MSAFKKTKKDILDLKEEVESLMYGTIGAVETTIEDYMNKASQLQKVYKDVYNGKLRGDREVSVEELSEADRLCQEYVLACENIRSDFKKIENELKEHVNDELKKIEERRKYTPEEQSALLNFILARQEELEDLNDQYYERYKIPRNYLAVLIDYPEIP